MSAALSKRISNELPQGITHTPWAGIARPVTVITGAIAALRAPPGRLTSPAWIISSEPAKAASASGRIKPCVSEMTPIT